MITIDDIPMSRWPSPLPLDITPRWLRFLGFPFWRFLRQDHSASTVRYYWVYLTRSQYGRIFSKSGL